MMKLVKFKDYLPLILLATAVLTILFSCREPAGEKKADGFAKTKIIYTCSMHPDIARDKPGECPICGMHLVKMEANPKTEDKAQPEQLPEITSDFSASGVPLTTMTTNTTDMPVEVLGDIQNDTREMASISARVSGLIEKMYVHYRYQMIKAGEKVMEVYSPEVATAQQNLLFILENDTSNTSLVESAKQRLLLIGMSSSQLQQLIKTRKASNTISVYSNASGHVHEARQEKMDVLNQAFSTTTAPLSIREGMYVQAGEKIFLLTNPDKAVAVLYFLPGGQHLVTAGRMVNIIPESTPGKTFQGKIHLVEPTYRNGNKTLAALVYFDNTRLQVPIGSQVRANIPGNPASGNWLPNDAVLSLGLNEVVFLKTGRGFVARKIVTGVKQGDVVQVISGLSPSDSVAAHAQYLTDSESFININQ